jgi:hypothetical protein
MNIKAATSAIVHEVRQPLAAMTTSATAAQSWLAKVSPDLSEIKSLMGIIEVSGFRAKMLIASMSRLT